MEHPNRKSPRAGFHNYNSGSFFVTACTRNKQHYFGHIKDEHMYLSKLGFCLHDNLQQVGESMDEVSIPVFVVMPNHFHAIICIDILNEPTFVNMGRLNRIARLSIKTDENVQLTTHFNSNLSTIVGGIKSHVTRFARKHGMEFAWQARFHDHIIRSESEGNRIAEYIVNNPSTWDSDCFKM